jgi:hypothetical protein
MAIEITNGVEFKNQELVTAIKLNNLVDKADWGIVGQVAGDIAYYDGSEWVRLPKGTDGQVLKLDSGLPKWVTEA